jgi:hypothetical protein
MCHLLRTNCNCDDFEDIHQVCPHTSSAWFIGQDLNQPQSAIPRLFKSHREIQQVAPFENGDVGNGDGNGLENIYTVVIF